MKSFNLFLTVALVLALTCLHAQEIEGGPVHSSKLDKENGFKKLVIGKTLKEVKSILMKTPLEPSQSRDPETYNAEYNTALYLVDLKKGYDKFLGVPVDRIEVLFAPNMWSEKENAPDAISEVVIYFKKAAENEKNCSLKMFEEYGGAYPVVDSPEPGDESVLWVGENTLMAFSNYYGGEESPKRDFFVVRFSSSKGG